MTTLPALENFPLKTVAFLKNLSKHNNKEWFEEHRDDYNEQFLEPAFQFIVEMGERLNVIVPGINAIPKIDKSVFRLHRDVRFSKDKSPYKTNLGIYFWEGNEKLAGSGFYFHADANGLFIGTGIYMPSSEQLKVYRNAVADPGSGKELHNAIKKVIGKGKYSLGGKSFKKVPRGYDADSPYSEYLLHGSLYVYYEKPDFAELTNNDPVEYAFKIFKDMLPVHQWLVKYLK